MRCHKSAWAWAIGLGMLGLNAGRAEAQVGPFGGMTGATAAGANTAAGSTPGAVGNPYLNPAANPYMNPFLNPYMMNGGTATGRTTMGLYMLNAQQNGNGIGSGKLGGPKATLAGRTAAKAAAKGEGDVPADPSNTPGGTAARYFGRRNPTNTGAARYYNRQQARR